LVELLLRRDSGWHLHILSADGAQLTALSESVDARGAAAWSPDGRWIVFDRLIEDSDIVLIELKPPR